MKTTHLLLSIPLALLAATGCTSDELQEKPQTNEKGEYAVHFNGNMDMTLTKASTSVAENVKANIYAYTASADVTSTNAIVSNGYTVGSTAGTFEGDADFVMYLPKGSYDFYAVSTNSATAAPTFTSGVSAKLDNGTDYIYAKPDATEIPGTNTVTLAFQRKAVMIEIKVQGSDSDGLELVSWQTSDPAIITPPTVADANTMALATGVITPASSIVNDIPSSPTTASAGKMRTASEGSFTASYIMLPVVADKTLKVQFKVNVKIGGRNDPAGEAKTYTASLTAPNTVDNNNGTAFLSGKKYTYTATLKANKIEFTGATVADWTTVNTTEDLNPTEPAS